MKMDRSGPTLIMLLLWLFWPALAVSQSFEYGIWYAISTNDAWVAFSDSEMVFLIPSSPLGCREQTLAGHGYYQLTMIDDDPALTGSVDIRCRNLTIPDFEVGFIFDEAEGLLTSRTGRVFRKVKTDDELVIGDPDPFIKMIKQWRSNSLEEWSIIGLLFHAPPPFAPPPNTGSDCSAPPDIEPGADLYNCDLTDERLRFAQLIDANLTDAVLRNVDLTGADLSGADMTGADLTGANLLEATLVGTTLVDVVWWDGDPLMITICPDGTSVVLDDGDEFTCLNNL